MLNMETTSRQIPERVAAALKEYFGAGGLGLETTRDTPGCLTFEGGGGYVQATLCADRHLTRLGLETREWEIAVQRFMSELH